MVAAGAHFIKTLFVRHASDRSQNRALRGWLDAHRSPVRQSGRALLVVQRSTAGRAPARERARRLVLLGGALASDSRTGAALPARAPWLVVAVAPGAVR